MKFVHAADLHLDSPLRGLQKYQGAPVEQIRGASRRAMESLVELCVAEEAQLLLIAGDVFDDDWRDYSVGLFFKEQMVRLRDAGVRVVWIRGNHDAASKITRQLKLPDNVRELSPRRAETVIFEEEGLAIHGQSFASAIVETDLARSYPAPVSGAFNIGLLHTALEGRLGHAPYAPCALSTLVEKGYDYWALGHVHTREVVHEQPWVVFPGNLQGRHAREAGAKGATLVNVADGRVDAVEHRPLDAVRWAVCDVDVTSATSGEAVLDGVRSQLERAAAEADGRLLAVRVVARGACRAHSALQRDADHWINEIRGLGIELSAADCWVEKVQLMTRPELDRQALRQQATAVGQLLRAMDTLANDADELAVLQEELDELRPRLGELAGQVAGMDREDKAGLRELLERAELLLLPQLLDAEGEP